MTGKSHPGVPQCSTTNVRESIAVPCAAGLTCSIFNEGDLTRDIPALGICISTEVALKQAQEPAKAPIEAQAPSRGNGQEQPPRAEASEDESGEMLRDRAARETASPGEAMSALEGGAEGDEHRDERDLGVGEGGAEKVGEVTEAVPSPWSMSGPCENTGDCCAPARCSRSGSQMWCVLPGGALGSLRSAGCE